MIGGKDNLTACDAFFEIPKPYYIIMTRHQVLRYKSVTLKYVSHENAGYIKFSVVA